MADKEKDKRTREQMVRDSVKRGIDSLNNTKRHRQEDANKAATTIARRFTQNSDNDVKIKEEAYIKFIEAEAIIETIGSCIGTIECSLTYL